MYKLFIVYVVFINIVVFNFLCCNIIYKCFLIIIFDEWDGFVFIWGRVVEGVGYWDRGGGRGCGRC